MLYRTFDDAVKVQACNNFNTAMVDGDFPASGSYIDVSDFERFVFLIHAGTLDSALTCTVQEVTAVNGTPSSVTGASVTIADDDDNKWFTIEVETRKLSINTAAKYVTLDVSGAGGGNDYLDIIFLGFNPGVQPVTQPTNYDTATVVAG